MRETSSAKAEVITNKTEAQKSQRKKATLTMSEAKQKEKAEITNKAERRGNILPRRHDATGSGLSDMEFDFISRAFVLDSEEHDDCTIRRRPASFVSSLGVPQVDRSGQRRHQNNSKNIQKEVKITEVPSKRGLRTMLYDQVS